MCEIDPISEIQAMEMLKAVGIYNEDLFEKMLNVWKAKGFVYYFADIDEKKIELEKVDKTCFTCRFNFYKEDSLSGCRKGNKCFDRRFCCDDWESRESVEKNYKGETFMEDLDREELICLGINIVKSPKVFDSWKLKNLSKFLFRIHAKKEKISYVLMLDLKNNVVTLYLGMTSSNYGVTQKEYSLDTDANLLFGLCKESDYFLRKKKEDEYKNRKIKDENILIERVKAFIKSDVENTIKLSQEGTV